MLTSHRPIRRFHVVVMLWTLKESTKKRDAHAEYCFFYVVIVFVIMVA